jgi:hypothetical protein
VRLGTHAAVRLARPACRGHARDARSAFSSTRPE